MASLFKNHLPDWDAALPPRSHTYDPFPSAEPTGQGDTLAGRDRTGASPFPPIGVSSPNDGANRVIGRICVAICILIFGMMAAQLLRSYLTGAL